MKLHIAAPVAGKGYAMVEYSDAPALVVGDRYTDARAGSHDSGG